MTISRMIIYKKVTKIDEQCDPAKGRKPLDLNHLVKLKLNSFHINVHSTPSILQYNQEMNYVSNP